MRIKRTFAAKVVTDPNEALVHAVYARAGQLEACADTVGVSHQTLSKQLNEADGVGLSLRRAGAIERFLDSDALAECFAARRGGLFIKLPALEGGDLPAELVNGYSSLIGAFAEASKAFSEALADRRITPAELDRFQKDLRDVYAAGERLAQAARAAMLAEQRT